MDKPSGRTLTRDWLSPSQPLFAGNKRGGLFLRGRVRHGEDESDGLKNLRGSFHGQDISLWIVDGLR